MNAATSVAHPDKIDLEERGLLRPLWQESAKKFLYQLTHGAPAHPPGTRLAPSPTPGDRILGHLREGVGDPLTSFLRWRGEVGDVVRLRLAGTTAHLLCHPRLVRAVLQERHRDFVKPIQGRQNMARMLGNGLLVSEGSFWLRQRRIAQPAFHKRRIDGFGERMVTAASQLADEWALRARREEAFDVSKDMMHVTLRVVQETLLGAEPTGDGDRIGDSVSYVLGEVNRRFTRVIDPPDDWPTPANRRFQRAKAVLDDAVFDIIRRRRAGEGGEDLLSMLLEARDAETGESMDDEQLRDEVMTIFLAGHETTANALSWTFYLLGRHPHVARRLADELREVLGDRDPTTADYGRLAYTQQVFRESMRLYPPAWIIARAPLEDIELDGYLLPAGSRVFLSPWVTHRHPEIWSDPEGFDPDRFADPKAIDRFAFFPFGGGPRLCIGHGFAMMEGVLILATLARRFHLELVPGHAVTPQPLVTLRPRDGVRVVARAR
ncbi:MAG: cytochrome P450 [Myxococcota bacterium]|nr:cytochrome P450 [Myxococcota bacterium]